MVRGRVHPGIAAAVVLTAGLACGVAARAECPYEWLPGEGVPGTDGTVYASAVFDDVAGPALYVGGCFSVAGSVAANRIAKWNQATQTWSPLGAGVGGAVYALAVLDGKLYAGGNFSTAGGLEARSVACWDPATQAWSSLGSGLGGMYDYVGALAVLGGRLYAAGHFTTAGELSVNGIACWDPAAQTWSALGTGTDGWIASFAVLDGKLYAAGQFSAAGGVEANSVAYWDPTTQAWSALGPGIWHEYWDEYGDHDPCWCGDPVCDCPPEWVSEPGEVFALTAYDGRLYAGGWFTSAGGADASDIACWDPVVGTWSPLGSGITITHYERVSALAVLDGRLYVGGGFQTAGGVNAAGIAIWDISAQTWSALGTDGSVPARTLAVVDGKVYVGGSFSSAGEASASNIACWDPLAQSWSALGFGVPGEYAHINAMAVLDGKLYAGGSFAMLGGVDANDIACWDPATQMWSALGTGTDGWVTSLVILNAKLYVGGSFDTAGPVRTRSIACWDPVAQAWSPVGAGFYAQVNALAVLDGKLCAGGRLPLLGDPIITYRVNWRDPATTTWSSLGKADRDVNALVVLDGKLYAGGDFTAIGGVSASNIACWDPITRIWSPLQSGIGAEGFPKYVYALAVLDGKLYVGGNFLTAGDVSAHNIACWDPATQTWSALGSWANAEYSHTAAIALAAMEGKLYAGGYFYTPGGMSANNIACWDPITQSWSVLGSGVNSEVCALAGLNGTLYVGGYFTTAGEQVSACFARWGPACPLGDLNCDNAVDLDDINPFVTALIGPERYHARYPGCPWLNADVDGDGDVSFDDINPFVSCLAAGGCP